MAPLAQFNPFSNSFILPSTKPLTPSPSLPLTPTPSSTAPLDVAAELLALEQEEERRKRKGVIAADLLSHYSTKDVQDEERERTRLRERSKWEVTEVKAMTGAGDGGGVMVGGLGLDSTDTVTSPLPSTSEPDDPEDEKRRRSVIGGRVSDRAVRRCRTSATSSNCTRTRTSRPTPL